MSDHVDGSQLVSLIARIERLEAEIAALNGDKREVYAEAKANGYDVKIMKALVSERRKDASDLAEQETLLDLYRQALTRAGAHARAA